MENLITNLRVFAFLLFLEQFLYDLLAENYMLYDKSTTAISKIQTIIIISTLLFSITISVLAWNNIALDAQGNSVESDISLEEPNSQQFNTEPEISTGDQEELQEPEEFAEPDQSTEIEPTQESNIKPQDTEPEVPTEDPAEPKQDGDPTNESPVAELNLSELAKVRIGDEEYFFDPTSVETTRPDLFKHWQFSMFDILVHLDKENKIDLEYHFDESMNTHIIELINGEPNWWYITFYSGGWSEQNVFRPDHYPWKQGTILSFYQTSSSAIADIHSVWKEEVKRRENNNGKIIIPEVIIRGNTFTKEFKNIEVTPHNLRNDTFQEDVITTIDVILSLGDQREITYELQWYDSIGTASIVRSYWIEAIDNDKAYGRCGFVYEAGAPKYRFFQGNHIHLPSDSRILNSPEYVEFFWICI